jgi:endonuclease/exonuclease/phosphatase family metal-dependent hydrolase
VLATTPIAVTTPSSLTKETTALSPDVNQLTLATFNVENLSPADGATKFNTLAARIVNNLRSPDIIAVEEIQDNNGATNDAVVDATQTYGALIQAIAAAGGPTYQFRQIDPADDQDGGEPGGNIRVGFLFNPNRVSFVDRAGGTATTATTVTNVNGIPQLSVSPGRIDPTNAAFNASRKPLVGEFQFQDQTLFVIANHWNSKGGDQPLYGPNQPPLLSSEAQRRQQAQVVNDFVDSLLAVNPAANIAVVGDLNDFQFSEPLNILKGIPGGNGTPVLQNLIETLPENERYTYNFQGNAQALDHILVSNGLLNQLNGYDVVHINSEFADQSSDHDPSVARFTFNPPVPSVPTVAIAVLTPNITEASGTPATLRISRTGDTTSALTVNYLLSGTASENDYSPDLTGEVMLAAGIASLDLALTAIDDALVEGNETLTLTLLDTATYDLSGSTTATITIADNDVPPPAGLVLPGTNRANRLVGTDRPDTLLGLGGNDRIVAGLGDDVINGGRGQDILLGGAGGDRFVYQGRNQRTAFANSKFSGTDRILDFNQRQGDRILLDYDTDATTSNRPNALFNAGVVSARNLQGAIQIACADKNGRSPGKQALRGNEALFLGWRGKTYLMVNDAIVGFSVNQDLLIEMTGMQFRAGDQRAGRLSVANYFV